MKEGWLRLCKHNVKLWVRHDLTGINLSKWTIIGNQTEIKFAILENALRNLTNTFLDEGGLVEIAQIQCETNCGSDMTQQR